MPPGKSGNRGGQQFSVLPHPTSSSELLTSSLVIALYTLEVKSKCQMELRLLPDCLVHVAHAPSSRTSKQRSRLNQNHKAFRHLPNRYPHSGNRHYPDHNDFKHKWQNEIPAERYGSFWTNLIAHHVFSRVQKYASTTISVDSRSSVRFGEEQWITLFRQLSRSRLSSGEKVLLYEGYVWSAFQVAGGGENMSDAT